MKYLALFLLVSAAYAQEVVEVKEMFLKNSADGEVVLTREECKLKAPGYFKNRAYATEGNGTVHEGCWMAPPIDEAPRSELTRIVPVVNTWWDGEIHMFLQSDFSPRLPEGTDEKAVDSIPGSI